MSFQASRFQWLRSLLNLFLKPNYAPVSYIKSYKMLFFQKNTQTQETVATALKVNGFHFIHVPETFWKSRYKRYEERYKVLRNIERRGTCSKSPKREATSQHENKYPDNLNASLWYLKIPEIFFHFTLTIISVTH